MELQLKKSGIETEFTRNIDLDWALKDISRLLKQYSNNGYILLFPFCSKKHQNKKWPYFKDLIVKLKQDYKNKFPILIAPGPNEIKEANKLNAKVVTDNQNPVDLKTLISLISNAKFILANDTGPAHIASHLDKAGLVLFGSHTSAKKVSIENNNFKALTVKNLKDLNVDTVISEIKSKLN
jgi:ADP-heptose:LPS heptosyltransferase